jgi:hypothetical protein
MNMIESLICKLEDLDEDYIFPQELLRIAYSNRLGDEWEAREKMVSRIIRAKREAGFPLKSNFFDDVWPVVLEAYLNRTETKE